eukprot:4210900-Prymnesium_polylepis.1
MLATIGHTLGRHPAKAVKSRLLPHNKTKHGHATGVEVGELGPGCRGASCPVSSVECVVQCAQWCRLHTFSFGIGPKLHP